MNILSKVTWKAMWKNRTRTIVTIIGVILSAAMFMAVVTAAFSFWSWLRDTKTRDIGDYYLQIRGASQEEYQNILEDPAVSHVANLPILGYYEATPESSPIKYCPVAAVTESFLETMAVDQLFGRMPENSSEILIPMLVNNYRDAQGLPEYEIGDSITIPVLSGEDSQSSAVEMTFTVVGIGNDKPYHAVSEHQQRFLLTAADENSPEPVNHSLFVLTHIPYSAMILYGRGYGSNRGLNGDLLMLYGISASGYYDNTFLMIIGLTLVCCAIIIAVTVSTVKNAFAISVSERTRQFGLLRSVGSTRKQLRRAVRFEALAVAAIGIPAGLVLGYGSIALIFWIFRDALANLNSSFVQAMPALLSPVTILGAVLLCLGTLLLSVRKPARRAARVQPIEAIRQSGEYHTAPRQVQVGKLTSKLFGFSALLGRKYYKVSRRKYRATVVALSISLVLFVLSGHLSDTFLLAAATAGVEDCDLEVTVTGEDAEDFIEALRSHAGVTQSALSQQIQYAIYTHISAYDPDYLTLPYLAFLYDATSDPDSDWKQDSIKVVYLEDEALEAYLRQVGLDPAPYFGEEPQALLVNRTIQQSYLDREDRRQNITYYGIPFADDVQAIQAYAYPQPGPLVEGPQMYHTTAAKDGTPLCVIYDVTMDNEGILGAIDGESTRRYAMVLTETEGTQQMAFHLYDPKTGQIEGKPAHTSPTFSPMLQFGARLEEAPFGVGVNNVFTDALAILPMSACPADEEAMYLLQLNTSDHEGVLSAVEQLREEYQVLSAVDDYKTSQAIERALISLIRAFAAGFILVVSMVSAANVFSTISTNLVLRRRDYGMFRSMGMSHGALCQMMVYECLGCGFHSMLWSVPISIVLSHEFHKIVELTYAQSYQVPWGYIAAGGGCIFLVVFLSMLYAFAKIKKDNPIEAIRQENL